ncbi:MAG: hypothetical protein JST00_32800 [Deltaproteobacteria bacterium]|nr:hypothetical protein [Deltaproteobacteria bacterium]
MQAVYEVQTSSALLRLEAVDAAQKPHPGGLTEAERQVFLRILASQSNEEIASARRAALRTTANQVVSVLRKVGVSSRYEAFAALLGRAEVTPALGGVSVEFELHGDRYRLFVRSTVAKRPPDLIGSARIVFDRVARGEADKQIGMALGVPTRAMSNRVRRLRAQLGVRRRGEIALLWLARLESASGS